MLSTTNPPSVVTDFLQEGLFGDVTRPISAAHPGLIWTCTQGRITELSNWLLARLELSRWQWYGRPVTELLVGLELSSFQSQQITIQLANTTLGAGARIDRLGDGFRVRVFLPCPS